MDLSEISIRIALVALIAFLEVFIIEHVWNNVIPQVFPGVKPITFKQSFLLVFLISYICPQVYLNILGSVNKMI